MSTISAVIMALLLIATLALSSSSYAQALAPNGANASGASQSLEACSEQFWRRAVSVASGHGANFEVEARQIGRVRCDCTFVRGQPKACQASTVSEDEVVPGEAE
jgi:hypothetical protein